MVVTIDELMDPKPFVNRERILQHIEPLDIFRFYIKEDFIVGKAMSSPFRDDTVPSFAIFENKKVVITDYQRFLYKDFVLGGGNCFTFVKMLFGYVSWFDAYSRIAVDFQIDDKYTVRKGMERLRNYEQIKDYTPDKRKSLDIKVKIRDIENRDMMFWKEFGITSLTLKAYDVYPISHIFITPQGGREVVISADSYAYAFRETKDGKDTFKIYQPFSRYKWMSSHNDSVWQGWKQLPDKHDYLIITKSLKDVMAIGCSGLDMPSVSLQAESVKPKDHIVKELKDRFDTIYLLYDNDFDKKENWGQKFANNLCLQHGFINLCLPQKEDCKDFSDLVQKKGMDKATKIVQELIRVATLTKSFNDIPY